MRCRPIIGGPFGGGDQFALASVACANGPKYFVVAPAVGAVLSVSGDKAGALSSARRLLKAANDASYCGKDDDAASPQAELWPDLIRPEGVVDEITLKPISRRRREVFERSGGLCHYCAEPLQIEGAWHVEHQLPRALGGTDDAINLVAACAPCNLRKGSKSAIEFVAERSR